MGGQKTAMGPSWHTVAEVILSELVEQPESSVFTKQHYNNILEILKKFHTLSSTPSGKKTENLPCLHA